MRRCGIKALEHQAVCVGHTTADETSDHLSRREESKQRPRDLAHSRQTIASPCEMRFESRKRRTSLDQDPIAVG